MSRSRSASRRRERAAQSVALGATGRFRVPGGENGRVGDFVLARYALVDSLAAVAADDHERVLPPAATHDMCGRKELPRGAVAAGVGTEADQLRA